MQVGDGLDRVVEAVAALPAVAEDLAVLHPADHMLHPGTHLAVGGVVVLLARQQGPARALAVRRDHPAVEVRAVAQELPPPVSGTTVPSSSRSWSVSGYRAWASAGRAADPDRVRADKAYGSRASRGYLRRRGIRCTIPEKSDQIRNRKKLRPRRSPAEVRQGRLPRAPRCRVRDQPPQASPGGGHEVRQTGSVRYEATVTIAVINEWL